MLTDLVESSACDILGHGHGGGLAHTYCSGAAVRRSSGGLGSGVSVREVKFLPLDCLPPSAVPWHAALAPFLCGYPYLKERPGILVNLRQPSGVITSIFAPRAGDHRTEGRTEVEWEEALLMAWGAEIPIPSAAFYRRKAAPAHQFAESVTTGAMKAGLREDASPTSPETRHPLL